jgi:hypothetical protein
VSKKVRKGTKKYKVLKLLSDGKAHKTNELALPTRTRAWTSAPYEDRHRWFSRAKEQGLIKRVEGTGLQMNFKKGTIKQTVTQWKITQKGKKLIENSE